MKTKTLEKENDKNALDWISREKTVRGVFEKVWKVWRTHKKLLFKTLTDWFSIGRKLDSIDRKLNLINQASIEHQSSQADSNQSFYRIFDRLSNRFDRPKIWKNETFEKQSNFMQKLLKSQYFMNEMHEYEIKSFSKTLEFNLDLPKTSFSTNLSPKLKH